MIITRISISSENAITYCILNFLESDENLISVPIVPQIKSHNSNDRVCSTRGICHQTLERVSNLEGNSQISSRACNFQKKSVSLLNSSLKIMI